MDNGAKALAAVLAGGCDCVLMDVQMPEMDGLEASRRIRDALPEERRPYIIAMTANAMAGDREACLEAGMDDYISKPIQLGTLADALARAARALQARARMARAADAAAALAAPAERGTPLAPAPGAGDNHQSDPQAADTMTAEDVLDMSQVDELIDLDETRAVLADFVGMFTTQAPARIAEMRDAFGRGDLERVAAVAHSLKGASGNLGAGVAVAVMLALVIALACVTYRGNQVVAAMAVNIMVAGLAPALALAWFDLGGQTPQLDGAGQRFLGLAWPWSRAARSLLTSTLAKIRAVSAIPGIRSLMTSGPRCSRCRSM